MSSESIELKQAKVTELATQKLPVYSVSRYGKSAYGMMTFWQESALAKAQRALDDKAAAVTTVDGYHVYVGKDGDSVSPHQFVVYLKGDELYGDYVSEGTNWDRNSVCLYSPESFRQQNCSEFKKIIEKVRQSKGLNSNQIQLIFSTVRMATNLNLTKTTNALLKAMDEHIQDLHRKMSIYTGLDTQTSQHKIALTEALIKFIEDPTKDSWAAVRMAMNSNRKYAFTWTGQSQTDAFLNRVKTLYAKDIVTFDSDYDQKYVNHVKSSWDLFFYHVGWMNYIFAIPDVLCKYFLNGINDLRRIIIHIQYKQTSQEVLALRSNNRILVALYYYLNNSTDEQINAMNDIIGEARWMELNPGQQFSSFIKNRDQVDCIIDDFDEFLAEDYPIHPNSVEFVHWLQYVAPVKAKLKSLYEEIIALVGEPYSSNVTLAP